ncbi:HpcH/HpaI aldolase/citrate lyase family protein [Thalassococcus sp. CAU 1522]|uniref:HpcH/HpaI aldolase/citrate lyase family protein n=1 Tax=Thalassococcus arenae TaxID=2851652 RepID=A0ABS6N6V3_9RHOB|nr:HpcH/HpaI aldolase/citrate lyase family protein [Thalassococcus arenae]MBV2359742.1 HpcH/HpaI aldolase/citrate lyase family protein [Thalassococcus arenae]
MSAPRNRLKALLAEGRTTFGLWSALADPYLSEIVARAGFDWVLIDGEHGPYDLKAMIQQAQVTEPYAAPVVRLPMAEPWLIKQVLDGGIQSLLIPMVNSADEARAIVRAMRYPPHGIRGMGHVLGRASVFGAASDYVNTVQDELCLIVQIESRAGLAALDEICAVDGVDCVFVGPADLAADLGKPFDGPEMREIVDTALRRIVELGKPAGIIDVPNDCIQRHLDSGATFVGVGADVVILSQVLRDLAGKWKGRAN